MIFVDTNILIHAANKSSVQHGAARGFVHGLRGANRPWFVSWSVVFEFLRVVTHPAVFTRPLHQNAALGFIDACLQTPTLEVLVATPRHRAVLDEVLRDAAPVSGNLWHDVHTVTLMREHGIVEIASYDRDFRRFTSVRVIEPA